MSVLDDLPTRRTEAWRWSDLRVAARDVDGIEAPGGREAFHLAGDTPDGQVQAFAASGDVARLAAQLDTSPIARFVVQADQTRTIRLTPHGERGAGAARVHIVVEPGGRLQLEETLRLSEGALGAFVIQVDVAEGALVSRVVRCDEMDGAVALSSAHVRLAAGAHLEQTTLTTGGKLARLETHVTVDGAGASATVNGVSLLHGTAHADHTTRVILNAPGAQVRETFRTVATDLGQGAFQGLFLVNRAAQKTDATMNHAGLIIGEGAAINAKPELEIYADDVACAHGATVGALDAAALFYMRQRGLPLNRARALLVEAFVMEALEGVEDEAAGEALRAATMAWMEESL